MVCAPGWDNYFNLNKSLPEMAQYLIDEDEQQVSPAPWGGTDTWKDDNIKIVPIPPDDDTVLVPASKFSSTQGSGTADNLVNLSDAPMEASNTGVCPEGVDTGNKSKILGHFSDALDEMAQCIVELEDGTS